MYYPQETAEPSAKEKEGRNQMKRWIALMLCLLVMAGGALADQKVVLPGEHYTLSLPDNMKYSPQNQVDRTESPYFQYAYYNSTLEMDVFMYANGGVTLRELAESMKEKELSVTIQSLGGVELLCYTNVMDEADGASCIGYVLMDRDQAIEMAFWYATQDAMDQVTEIIGSLQ